MLKYRLIFGTLMVTVFVGLIVLGGWLDGSLTESLPDKAIKGSVLCILLALMAIFAQLEMAALSRKTNAVIFTPITIIASILLATGWYWRQFHTEPIKFHLYYVLLVSAFSLFAVFLYQAKFRKTEGVITNCSANYFAIFYLGLLSSFIVGIRIDYGPWALFMFIATVKSSDIGAYTAGRIFGKHKFSPKISPGKTWEGLAGAVVLAIIVAVVFSILCNIMVWYYAAIFGAIFAYFGQLGDLAESMIKRDAEQKDSSNTVPGFGGILDVIDSLLATAPLAYLFYMLTMR